MAKEKDQSNRDKIGGKHKKSGRIARLTDRLFDSEGVKRQEIERDLERLLNDEEE